MLKQSRNWYTPAPGERYIPNIVVLEKLSLLDPFWRDSIMYKGLTAFDPPRALTPVAGMAPVITKSPTPSRKPSPDLGQIPPKPGTIASSESPPWPAATPKLGQAEKTRGLTSMASPLATKSSGLTPNPEFDGPKEPTVSADPQVHTISPTSNDPTSQGSAGHGVDLPHDGELPHAHEQSHLPLKLSIVIDGSTTIVEPFDRPSRLYATPGGLPVADPHVATTSIDEEGSLFSSLHVYHLTSESKLPITVGSKAITPISQGFVFHGSSITQGRDSVVVSGTRISMDDHSHIVIGTDTYKLPGPQSTKILATVLPNGASIHPLSSGRYVYQGATLTPGSPPAIVSGTTLSLHSSDDLFILEVTRIKQGASHATMFLATVAGVSVTLLHSAVEVAGTTLHPGAPAITISGTPVAFNHTALIVGSLTLSLQTSDA